MVSGFFPAAALVCGVAACAPLAVGRGAPSNERPRSGCPTDAFEKVELGGQKQQIWIHGDDAGKPLLLFLHGGPGEPHMNLSAGETNLVSGQYIVVQWDQRGSGASYSEDIDARSLTIRQAAQDAYDLVVYLLRRFKREKLFLLGHSWGSSLGLRLVQSHPELFYAYVAIGLPVGGPDGIRHLRAKLVAAGTRMKSEALASWTAEKDQALRTLETLDVDSQFADRDAFQKRYLSEFGRPRNTLGFTWVRDEKRVSDYLGRGANAHPHLSGAAGRAYEQLLERGFELNRYLMHEAISRDVSRQVRAIKVPLLALLGRHDSNVDAEAAERFLDQLVAPRKRVVWFEQSAHMMTFEEPERFQDLMIHELPHLCGCEALFQPRADRPSPGAVCR
jgi:pimeloyl-ACP methyl ester carboxylesterase